MSWILAAVVVLTAENVGFSQQPPIPSSQVPAPLIQIVHLSGDQYSGFRESCVVVHKDKHYHRERRQQESKGGRPTGNWNPVKVSDGELASTDFEALNTIVQSTEFQGATGTLGDPDLSGQLVFGLPSVTPHDIVGILAASVPRPGGSQVFEVFLRSAHLEASLKSFVKWVDTFEKQALAPVADAQATNCAISPYNGTSSSWEPNTVPPNVIFEAKPTLSDDQRLRADGKVQIRAIVNIDGGITPVAVIHGINPVLDQLALDTVKRWKFEPARLVGFPVATPLNVEVKFRSR